MAVEKPPLPVSIEIEHTDHAYKLKPENHSRRTRKSVLLKVLAFILLFGVSVITFNKGLNDGQVRHSLASKPFQAEVASSFEHGSIKGPLTSRRAEQLFLTVPNSASAIAASRLYATKPHMAGTPQDLVTAKLFLQLLQRELSIPTSSAHCDSTDDDLPIYSAGSPSSRNATLSIPTLTSPNAWIDVYYPFMNTPLNHSLEVISNQTGEVVWKAELEEKADERDPEAGKYKEEILTWHGLSKGGEASGRLVYAKYGRKEDYDELVEQGVNLTGAVVLARYGGDFRGLKIKGAEELGASAVLIYSDPRDDGHVTEENGYEAYPSGPARNPTSVQRGSVQFLSIYPGDPTTPGYPAYENATRTEGSNIPKIPSLPISWANAKQLLELTKDGNTTVKVVNNVDDKVIPIWNTVGVIPGHIKDEVVVIGNHRDAWVMGATDPSSGTASAHEVIRGFGLLVKAGWKPLRTIVIASWDAEEYGLIGSTEWGEDFADWIEEHVVAYFNLDSSVSGSRFSASGSPSLAHLIRSTAEDIPHPTAAGRTLWDATTDSGTLFGENVDAEAMKMYESEVAQVAASSLGVSPLGSGSDYTVFLQRIGVASGNEGFGSTPSDPVYHYHSVYDSERWQEIYADPGFVKHVAIAKHLGLQTLRFADSVILPLNTTNYAYELETYLERVENIAGTASLDLSFAPLRKSIKKLGRASVRLDKEKKHAEHHLRHILKKWKRRHGLVARARKVACKLREMLGKECRKNDELDEFLAKATTNDVPGCYDGPEVDVICLTKAALDGLDVNAKPDRLTRRLIEAVKRVQKVNTKLASFERGFISKGGIKDREWYRHLGVAPGKWLGYGATTFPALTEAITIEKNTTLAEYEAERLQNLIDKLAENIRP